MILLDGKHKLKPEMVKQLFDSAKDDEVILISVAENEPNTCSKTELLSTVFSSVFSSSITDTDVVTLATEDVALELLKIDVDWWATPSRFKKLEAQVTDTSVKAVKQASVVIEKTIAVGRYSEQTGGIYDSYAKTFASNKPKEALDWLNNAIATYELRHQLHNLRICMNYTEKSVAHPEEWLTIQQLIEKGLAKV